MIGLVFSILLLLVAHGTCSSTCGINGNWTGSKVLDENVNFTVNYRIDGDELVLGISAEMRGWLGFGIGEFESGSMVGADIVTIVFEEATCEIVAEDRYVPWRAFPFAPYGSTFHFADKDEYVNTSPSLFPELDADGCQDWTVLEGEMTDTCTKVIVKRKLVTGDIGFDRDIVSDGDNRVIWAHGFGETISYHGSKRGATIMDFSKPDFQETFESFECSSGDCFFVDVKMNEYQIPAQETTYACQSIELPADPEAHIVAFYPIVDSVYAHHLLLHMCEEDYFNDHVTADTCGGGPVGTSPLAFKCQSLIYAWAKGGRPVIMPPAAGVRINNTTKRIVLEIHYNNPDAVAGEMDNTTAVRVVMTPTLRPHDATMMVVGDPTLGMDPLPKGKSDVHRVGECSRECTEQAISEQITIFSGFLHMHSFGKQMFTNLYDKDMNFKSTIQEIGFYNFEFQTLNPLQVTMDPGDILFTHCVYDTSKWTHDVNFGLGSLDEMCQHFLYYYPAQTFNGNPLSVCGGGLGLDRGATAYGIKDQIESIPLVSFQDVVNIRPHYRDMMFGFVCNNVGGSNGHQDPFTINNPFGNDFRIDIPANRLDTQVWDGSKHTRPLDFGSVTTTSCPTNINDTATGICNITSGDGGDSACDKSDDPSYDCKIDNIIDDLRIDWAVDTDTCRLAVQVSVSGDRWIGFGLGTQMVGSRVVIGGSDISGGVSEYSIGAKSRDGLSNVGTTNLVDAEFAFAGGRSTLRFKAGAIHDQTFKLDCATINRRVLQDSVEKLVFAVGESGTLEIHDKVQRASITWSGGLVGQSPNDLNKGYDLGPKFTIHIIGMTVAFGLGVPLLITFPLLKQLNQSKWFLFHRALASIAMLAMIVGLVPIILHMDEVYGKHGFEAHHIIGFALTVNLCLNPILGLLRPDKTDPRRSAWLSAHRVSGYSSWIGGLVNIILGFSLVEFNLASKFETALVLIGLISSGLIFVVVFVLRWKTKQAASDAHENPTQLSVVSPVEGKVIDEKV